MLEHSLREMTGISEELKLVGTSRIDCSVCVCVCVGGLSLSLSLSLSLCVCVWCVMCFLCDVVVCG